MKRQQELERKEPEPKKVQNIVKRFVHNVKVQESFSFSPPFMYTLCNGAFIKQGDGAFRGWTGSWFSYFMLPSNLFFDPQEFIYSTNMVYSSDGAMPPMVQKFFDWVNSTIYKTAFTNPFNQCAVDYYKDCNDCYCPRSFDETIMEKNAAGETVVILISFGIPRKFKLIAKDQQNPNHVDYEMDLVNNSVVVMGGTCQRTHNHTLLKGPKKEGQHLSLTFRITSLK